MRVHRHPIMRSLSLSLYKKLILKRKEQEKKNYKNSSYYETVLFLLFVIQLLNYRCQQNCTCCKPANSRVCAPIVSVCAKLLDKRTNLPITALIIVPSTRESHLCTVLGALIIYCIK